MHLLELVMDFVSIFTLKQDWNISQRTDCNRLVFDCSRLKPKKLRQLAIQHLSRLQLLLFQAYQKAHEVLKMDCRRRTLPKILARNEKEFSYSDIHISLCNRFSNNTNTAAFKSIFIKHICIYFKRNAIFEQIKSDFVHSVARLHFFSAHFLISAICSANAH